MGVSKKKRERQRHNRKIGRKLGSVYSVLGVCPKCKIIFGFKEYINFCKTKKQCEKCGEVLNNYLPPEHLDIRLDNTSNNLLVTPFFGPKNILVSKIYEGDYELTKRLSGSFESNKR